MRYVELIRREFERTRTTIAPNYTLSAAFLPKIVSPQKPYETLHNQAASNTSEMKAIAAAAPFTAAFNT
jgi:hypothetical protein